MIHAFALIDHTQSAKPALDEKDGQGARQPNVYFEVSSAQELTSHMASLQFAGSRVLRIYHKPGDWVLVGPLHLHSSYGTAIEQPILTKAFANDLWQSALARLALRKQQEVQYQFQSRGSVSVSGQIRMSAEQGAAIILPFERPG